LADVPREERSEADPQARGLDILTDRFFSIVPAAEGVMKYLPVVVTRLSIPFAWCSLTGMDTQSTLLSAADKSASGKMGRPNRRLPRSCL